MANDSSSGSVGFGIIATIIGIAVMGTFPLIGWLFPGIFGGLVAKGKARGLVSALIGAGIVVVIAIEFALYIIPNTGITNMLTTYTGNSMVTSHVLAESGYIRSMMKSNFYSFVGKIISDGIVIAGLGGLIGGSIIGITREDEGF
ncbi:MAG: hypothetical protein ACYDAO_05050 [Thermoplasmataceae archaeon]